MDDAVINSESLYAKRVKIHAREVQGFFENLRNGAVFLLLGAYYLGPWLRWEERQAVLFDLPARKFHIFALTLWPQDFFFLSWLLVMAALLLFFATTLVGRAWCGYACPQTVWTQAFVWMERLTEGTFAQRIKLDKAPWSTRKLLRKGAKQALWIGFASWTGFTFVGYFTPIHELGARLFAFELGGWETFWVCFYSVATYGNAGHLREQVCKYMCPYARFQSAMFDRDTLIVSYDPARGEPRGGRKRGANATALGLGDCVDCNFCVQACPTGIDIRKGLQYECITCASCIDACDAVMDRFGYPRGLIRYTTQNALQGKRSHVVRPRIIVYGTLLAALFAGFVVTLASRAAVHLDVLRDRNAMYRELADGRVENVYQLKILNKDDQRRVVRVTIAGLSGATVETAPANPELAPGSVLDVIARVSVPPGNAPPGGSNVTFRLESVSDGALAAERTARFMAPMK